MKRIPAELIMFVAAFLVVSSLVVDVRYESWEQVTAHGITKTSGYVLDLYDIPASVVAMLLCILVRVKADEVAQNVERLFSLLFLPPAGLILYFAFKFYSY